MTAPRHTSERALIAAAQDARLLAVELDAIRQAVDRIADRCRTLTDLLKED